MSIQHDRYPSSGGGPDALLLDQARDGDVGAYQVLLERYRDRIAGYAFRLTGDAAIAEDITQESFLRLWRALFTRPVEGNAGAWLHRVARNLAIDRLRLRGREDEAIPETHPSSIPDASSQLQAKDTAERVRQAIMTLPERQRAAITLVHYQQMSGADAAAQLEITVEALESLLARGRRKLRQALSEERADLGPVPGEAS